MFFAPRWAWLAASFPALAAVAPQPVYFEPNVGQTAKHVQFLSRSGGAALFVTDRGATVVLSRRTDAPTKPGDRPRALQSVETAVTMRFEGARAARAEGLDAAPGVSHYFPGPDPLTWRTDVPHFQRMKLAGVYPGIDLVFHGANGALEYDFVVAPGADPSVIRLAFDGASKVRTSEDGSLLATTALGDLRQPRPRVYQDIAGRRVEIEADYRIDGGRVAFALADYDQSKPLVIDPVLLWSSLLGGGGTDSINGVAVDALSGASYVAGVTRSSNFPVSAPLQGASAGSQTAFVSRISAAGTLDWSTYFGSETAATGVAVDSLGFVYFTGYVAGSIPVLNPVQPNLAGGLDAFVAKIRATGRALEYATYVGGVSEDNPSAIGVDGEFNAYIAGITNSSDFPALRAYQSTGAPAAFVTKLGPAGNAYDYSTRLVFPEAGYSGVGFAVDAAGGAYVTGRATSGIPNRNAYQSTVKGGTDAFILKFGPRTGTANVAVEYASYFGGTGDDFGTAIATNGSGTIAITGGTYSTDLPTRTPAQATLAGGPDAFLVRVNAFGLLTATYLGGTLSDVGKAIAFAPRAEVVVAGETSSTNFLAGGGQLFGPAGGVDGFVVRVNELGNSLPFATYIGGRADEVVHGLAVDAVGVMNLAGETRSDNYPQVNSLQGFSGTSDGFLSRISPCVTFGVDPRARTAAAGGGNQTVNVAADSACSWTPSTTTSWITLLTGASTGGGTVGYTVAANTGPERVGHVAVSGLGVTVTQASGLAAGGSAIAAPTITDPAANSTITVSSVTFAWLASAGANLYDTRVFDASTSATVFTGTLAGADATNTVVTLPDGAYVFAVRGCTGSADDANCGSFSTRRFTLRTTGPALAPSITAPTEGQRLTSSVQTFTWTEVSGATRYEVLLEDIAQGISELSISTPGLDTIYTLRSSTSYRLRVRACTGACGPWSIAVNFQAAVPAVPTDVPRVTSANVSQQTQVNVVFTVQQNNRAEFYRVLIVQSGAGPGGGALTVATAVTTQSPVVVTAPQGAATVFVAACNGNGCGPNSTGTAINVPGPNPATPVIGLPVNGLTADGPAVFFSWSRVPGDNGSNTQYRLFVQDLSRQAPALDVITRNNFYSANLRAEGTRYDAVVIANPLTTAFQSAPVGFNLRGNSALAPTMVAPTHDSAVAQGNVTVSWSPVTGATLYEYFVAILGQNAVVRGVTPGLSVRAPLSAVGGQATIYSGIVRACPAGQTCAAGSDAGWGPWSNVAGSGVTNFQVNP